MSISWSDDAWEDYLYWQESDKKIVKRINQLIQSAQRTPAEGIGKPEPLKHQHSGYWSRRINQEHRLVYKSTTETLIIVQCRYHY